MELKLTKPKEKYFFLIVLPIALAIEWAFAGWHDWVTYPRSEWVALVDLCVFMPLVYLALFASELPLKARLIRATGIAGVGLLASSFIVPESNQFFIAKLSNARNVLLIFVIAFEGWVFWKVINALYRTGADARSLERDFAMPAWVAKLMVLEAKFWKAVWSLFRRK